MILRLTIVFATLHWCLVDFGPLVTLVSESSGIRPSRQSRLIYTDINSTQELFFFKYCSIYYNVQVCERTDAPSCIMIHAEYHGTISSQRLSARGGNQPLCQSVLIQPPHPPH